MRQRSLDSVDHFKSLGTSLRTSEAQAKTSKTHTAPQTHPQDPFKNHFKQKTKSPMSPKPEKKNTHIFHKHLALLPSRLNPLPPSPKDVTKTFCAKNGLAMIVRSHQSKKLPDSTHAMSWLRGVWLLCRSVSFWFLEDVLTFVDC